MPLGNLFDLRLGGYATTLVLASSLMTFSASAQEEGFGGDEEESDDEGGESEGGESEGGESAGGESEGGEEGGEGVGAEAASGDEGGGRSGGDRVAPSGGEGGEATDAPETYTVQRGDTLWNLSAKFLNNPWYWPKIWSYNPQLDNPNWIYPGNVIRFYPGEDGSGEAQTTGPAEGEATAEAASEEDELGEDEDVDLGDDADMVGGFEAGDVARDLRRLAELRGVMSRRQFFVPAKKLQEAGEVENSPDEQSLLSLYDPVWVDFKTKPEPGTVLQVFRPTKTISHPVTGFPLGVVVELVGEVRVDANSEAGKSLSMITASWDSILRGDYVAALDDAQIRRVEPVPNDKELKGYVVDTAFFEGESLGQHHLVFVDRGEKDGVKPGNTFTVVRAGDPLTGDTRGLTDEVIGKIVVTDVRDKTSVGLVTYSNRNLERGDRVEMRVEQ